MAGEHVESLKRARELLRDVRRERAKVLGRESTTMALETFIEIQNLIEAVDRALKDEEAIASQAEQEAEPNR